MLAYQAVVVSVALFTAQFFPFGREIRTAEAGNIASLLAAPMNSITPDALSSVSLFAPRRRVVPIDLQAGTTLLRPAVRLGCLDSFADRVEAAPAADDALLLPPRPVWFKQDPLRHLLAARRHALRLPSVEGHNLIVCGLCFPSARSRI